jgi:hypothetical protein
MFRHLVALLGCCTVVSLPEECLRPGIDSQRPQFSFLPSLQGKCVCEHVAQHFVALEEEAHARDDDYAIAHLSTLHATNVPSSHALPSSSGFDAG